MDPVAILITKENYNEYRTELHHAVGTPNGYDPSYWTGYYLVVTEGGPEIMTATRFANTYVFVIDPTKLMPIRTR